jgi:uncharacterized LabA/DUF88 family protein
MAVSDLQEKIEQSHLSDKDKDMWVHALELMDDEQADMILEAIGDDDEELNDMTRNIKLKRVALASGDGKLFEQLLDDEVHDIEHS